jgi:hypothetical protein
MRRSASVSTDDLKMSVEEIEERRNLEPQVKKMRSGALYYSWNGLDLDRERDTVLSRDHLVEKLRSKLDEHRIVMLCSPPATGKTALCQMLVKKYQFENKIISRRTGDIPIDELEVAGINFKQQVAQPRDHLCVVMVDFQNQIWSQIWYHFGQQNF